MITSVLTPEMEARLDAVFGDADDPMPLLASRAETLLEGTDAIVWEGDAETFQFLFVSDSAETVLGYPSERWVTEPTFWIDTVLHPQDRNDAVAFCALATGRRSDHDFVYRAVRSDGSIVRLHDVVKVVLGPKGIPIRLRGIMIPIADDEER